MIWSIDLDDFSGSYCGHGQFPITNAMRRVLDGRKVVDRFKLKSGALPGVRLSALQMLTNLLVVSLCFHWIVVS